MLLAAASAFAPLDAQERGGQDVTGPYEVVDNWMESVEEGWYHHVTGVFAESGDRIFVTASGLTPIAPPPAPGEAAAEAPRGFDPTWPGAKSGHFVVVLDREGRIVENWTGALDILVRPHSVQISPFDPERHVWIIDRDGHQIVKFTNDGSRVVMVLGERGVAGTDKSHFGRPSDIAFLPDGSFLVADGYDNARIVKFDRNGQYLFEWGRPGAGPGEFDLAHCVAVDAQGRVYVADRGNRRIQVFEQDGTFLVEWPSYRPTHLLITPDQFLWVADGLTNRFVKYGLDGRMLDYWGTQGSFPGAIDNPHKFSVDPEGHLYVVDYANNRLQKYVPAWGADPARLMVRH